MLNEVKKMYILSKILLKIITLFHLEKLLSDKSYLKLQYFVSTKKRLNLNNPTTYNEKIQWLKLFDHNPFYNKVVDKYDVREYIKEKIGEKYLIKLYGVYSQPDEINYNLLPNSFVVKCTHDSGNVYICNDKTKIDYCKLNNVYKGLKRNFYYASREWPYKNLIPRIIIEENLSRNEKIPSDYKLMCFNGKVEYIQLHTDRFNNHNSYLYDKNGNPTEFNNVGNEKDNLTAPKLSQEIINKMINLAEQIASDFIHVRVDFYYVDEQIYFGELTLYDGAGLIPWTNKGDEILGNALKIN